MKKSFVAVALVVVFALAMAGTAFASWDDSTYTTWAEASAATGAGTSPHYGFKTTTKNCAVCHAVHNAPSSGSQVLLRSTVGNSCNYCHVDLTNNIATDVYGGVEANYTTDIRGNHGGNTAAECVDCHAVHSANTVANGSRILLLQADYTAAGESTPTLTNKAGAAPTTTDIAKWCSGCHPYYYTAYNKVSHVMTGANGVNGNVGVRTFTGAVSAVASSLCQDCHNSATLNVGWPHYTPTNPRFLTDGITSSVNPAVVNNDAPCLRCHTQVGTMY